MVNAVVLAGAVDERLPVVYQGPTKALIPVSGKPCVEHVLEALRGGSRSQDVPGQACRASTDHPRQGHSGGRPCSRSRADRWGSWQ
jgi:hypothetical protein